MLVVYAGPGLQYWRKLKQSEPTIFRIAREREAQHIKQKSDAGDAKSAEPVPESEPNGYESITAVAEAIVRRGIGQSVKGKRTSLVSSSPVCSAPAELKASTPAVSQPTSSAASGQKADSKQS